MLKIKVGNTNSCMFINSNYGNLYKNTSGLAPV